MCPFPGLSEILARLMQAVDEAVGAAGTTLLQDLFEGVSFRFPRGIGPSVAVSSKG